MKAAQISEYGGKEVLKTVDSAKKPEINTSQVLVEVYAAGVNPFDYKVRSGEVKAPSLPATLGGDVAGKVVEIGSEASGFAVGDEVYGEANALGGQGSFAEFTPVKASQLASKPQNTDFIHAAALPLVGTSAVQALIEHTDLQSGQKILIHGGAGGIGSVAIQLAKHLGAYVATTVSATDKEFAKSLGADEVIDYKSQDFSALLEDYNAVYDTVGGDTYRKSFKILKPGGIIVSMVEQTDGELATKHQAKAVYQFTQATTERLTKLADLVEQGAIKVNVAQTFPLEEADAALAYLQEASHRGKVVIEVKKP